MDKDCIEKIRKHQKDMESYKFGNGFEKVDEYKNVSNNPGDNAMAYFPDRSIRKIYVASSWKNDYQPEVVGFLKKAGFDVYDFRNPGPGDNGFSWESIDPEYKNWTAREYKDALNHPLAQAGFLNDFSAMWKSHACVLVLPCGRSAHIEAGYFIGAQKKLVIYIPEEKVIPYLMYKMTRSICFSLEEVKNHLLF